MSGIKVADLFASLGLRTNKAEWNRGRDEMGRFVAGAQKKTQGISKAVGVLQSRLTRIFSGVAVGLAARSAFNFSEELTDLGIASDGAVGNLRAYEDKLLDVSDATNVTKEALLQGQKAFIAQTGEGKIAIDTLELLGKVTTATKGKTEELSRVQAAMFQNMEIMPSEFEKGFSVLIAGGKAGAVELKDMAGELPSLAAQFSKFTDGKGVQGLATLGAMLQLVKQGFGTVGEAATASSSLMRGLQRGAARFAAKGVAVYGKDGKTLRSVFNIVEDIKKQGFTGTQLSKLFGREEGKQAYEQLVKNAGAWEKLRKETLKGNRVQEDFNKRMNSSTARLGKLWNKLKNSVHRVMREVIDFGAVVSQHLDKVAMAVTVLGTAFLILQGRAVAAALATAAGWAAALLPIVLLGTALIGLAALYESATGRDAFDDMLNVVTYVLKQLKAVYKWAKKILGEFSIGTATYKQLGGGTSEAINRGALGKDAQGNEIKDKFTRDATVLVNKLAQAEHATSGSKGSVTDLFQTAFSGGVFDLFGGKRLNYPMHDLVGYREQQIKELASELRTNNITLNISVGDGADSDAVARGAEDGVVRAMRKVNR